MTSAETPYTPPLPLPMEVNFTPVPERTLKGLDVTLDLIALIRRYPDAASFGGYVIRGASERIGIDALVRLGYDEAVAYGPARCVASNDSRLHVDTSRSLHQNEVTAHCTVKGIAEAILLVGSEICNKNVITGSELTTQLFDHLPVFPKVGRDGAELSPPLVAMRTTLGAGDLLIFDHTQPHAFRSLTSDRESFAYYD